MMDKASSKEQKLQFPNAFETLYDLPKINVFGPTLGAKICFFRGDRSKEISILVECTGI